jgi:hypothetical protein
MFQSLEKIKTHIVCSVTFFENRAVYEIIWKNTVDRGRPQMTVWRMRIAYCIPKAKITHTQVVYYLLLFHFNNGCTNAPQCYVICTLLVLFMTKKVCVYCAVRTEYLT